MTKKPIEKEERSGGGVVEQRDRNKKRSVRIEQLFCSADTVVECREPTVGGGEDRSRPHRTRDSSGKGVLLFV